MEYVARLQCSRYTATDVSFDKIGQPSEMTEFSIIYEIYAIIKNVNETQNRLYILFEPSLELDLTACNAVRKDCFVH